VAPPLPSIRKLSPTRSASKITRKSAVGLGRKPFTRKIITPKRLAVATLLDLEASENHSRGHPARASAWKMGVSLTLVKPGELNNNKAVSRWFFRADPEGES